jgi:hypothetical protein
MSLPVLSSPLAYPDSPDRGDCVGRRIRTPDHIANRLSAALKCCDRGSALFSSLVGAAPRPRTDGPAYGLPDEATEHDLSCCPSAEVALHTLRLKGIAIDLLEVNIECCLYFVNIMSIILRALIVLAYRTQDRPLRERVALSMAMHLLNARVAAAAEASRGHLPSFPEPARRKCWQRPPHHGRRA